MPTSPETKSFMRRLLLTYGSRVLVIALLIAIGQALIQYTLYKEIVSRQVYALIAGQGIAATHLQRNTLLLFAPGEDRGGLDRQIAADIATLETNHARYLAQYASVYPQLASTSRGVSPYAQVDSAARAILALEQKPGLTLKQRGQQEGPFIKQLFFAGNTHLDRVIQSLAVVNADSNSYIAHIQLIELSLFLLTLVLLFFVIYPAINKAHRQFKAIEEKLAVPGKAQK